MIGQAHEIWLSYMVGQAGLLFTNIALALFGKLEKLIGKHGHGNNISYKVNCVCVFTLYFI